MLVEYEAEIARLRTNAEVVFQQRSQEVMFT